MDRPNNQFNVPMGIYLSQYRAAAPEEIAKRCGLSYGGGRFNVTYMGNSYLVSYPDYIVELQNEAKYADVMRSETAASRLLLLHHLVSGTRKSFGGGYLAYRDIPWGSLYNPNFTGKCISRLARKFGDHIDTFRERIVRLPAAEVRAAGDFAVDIEVMPELYMRFILWAGEAEDGIAPAAQILFSDNFPAAFTAEDTVGVADEAIKQLTVNQ
ncbi:MAG: DUF3786 domain-containing protein [Oscillospiraceae bacterium]|jgi:hypothetical protein|nr:DUF3786 domain-containing protein [Oscillospiraceae bacterium]